MNTPRYRNTLIAAALAATFGVGLSACSDTDEYAATTARSNSATDAMSDTVITTKVKAQLASDSSIQSSNIEVSTANGVVTMDGYVNDAAASSAAERTAKAVSGVTRVQNRLTTSSSTMSSNNMSSDSRYSDDGTTIGSAADDMQEATSDAWITTKVKTALLADSDAKGFDVNVETNNGVVTLQGEMDTQAAIDHVREIAAKVDGVKSVNVTAMTVSMLRS